MKLVISVKHLRADLSCSAEIARVQPAFRHKLDILRASGCPDLSGCRLCLTEGVLAGFLLCVLLDLDRTFEQRSVFTKNLRCRQISGHRSIISDFDPASCSDVPLQVASYDDFGGDDISLYVCRW